MKFDPQKTSSASFAGDRREILLDDRWLIPYLQKNKTRLVTELGSGSASRASWLLETLPEISHYRGFEPSAHYTSAARARLAHWPGRAGVEQKDPVAALPLATASQDAFLTLDILEFLRMDQLYMVVSEARRTLRPGGLWLLRSLALPKGIFPRAMVRAFRPRGSRALDLTHYVSPEDWRTVELQLNGESWLKRQILVLERL